MKPRWLRRNWSCPDCGLIVEEDDLPKHEGWGPPFIKPQPAFFFDCSRCQAHYNAEEFFQLNQDKWSQEAKL